MTDTRIEATCELCETPIVNGTAGWHHVMGLAARGGCGLALAPALPIVFEEIEPLEPLTLSGCGSKGASAGGCASCG